MYHVIPVASHRQVSGIRSLTARQVSGLPICQRPVWLASQRRLGFVVFSESNTGGGMWPPLWLTGVRRLSPHLKPLGGPGRPGSDRAGTPPPRAGGWAGARWTGRVIKNTWAGHCAPRRQRADLAHVSASGEVVRDLTRGGALRRTGRHCVFSLFSISFPLLTVGRLLCAEASASRVAPCVCGGM